jgi:ribosomal protein S27E
MTDKYLDGNVLGGTLNSVFAVDVTGAQGRCANCGNIGALGTSHVYTRAAGAVARCPACGEVLLRVVGAPGRLFLDLRGLSFLELRSPEGAMG